MSVKGILRQNQAGLLAAHLIQQALRQFFF